MEFLPKLLLKFGFLDYLDAFKAEGYINKEEIFALTYEGLKSVIVKGGPRDVFWSKLQSWKEVYEEEESQEYQMERIDHVPQDYQQSTSFFDYQLVSTPTTTMKIVTCNPEEPIAGSSRNVQPAPAVYSTVPMPTVQPTIHPSVHLPVHPPAQQIPVEDSAHINTVKKYLGTTEGKVLQECYKKEGYIPSMEGTKLCDYLIAREYEQLGERQEFVIPKSRLLQLRDQILEEFPNEKKEIYFIPFEKATLTSAKGKLYQAFNGFKKKMGLTKPHKKKTPRDETTGNGYDALEYVKNHLSPTVVMKKYWKESRVRRLENFNTLEEYLQDFPILSTQSGYEYFFLDFDEKYPNSESTFQDNWSSTNADLLKYAVSQEKKARALKTTLKDVHEELAGLYVLAHYLATSAYTCDDARDENTKETKKKKRTKFTREEVTRGLFIYATECNGLLDKVSKHFSRKDKAPILAFSGDHLGDLSNFNVAISKDTMFSFESVLQALDAYMKICIVCKSTYPAATAPIWSYLEKYVFQIRTSSSEKFLSVFELNNKITALLNRQNE
ncbi:uncharacterized protein DMENIID0001_131510 [Sergentomyia squamirostris]